MPKYLLRKNRLLIFKMPRKTDSSNMILHKNCLTLTYDLDPQSQPSQGQGKRSNNSNKVNPCTKFPDHMSSASAVRALVVE